MAKNVAEVFIETLVKAGVKRVYGVSGDSLNGLTDTIRKNKKIEWLHVRHEEVAAFAPKLTLPVKSLCARAVAGRATFTSSTDYSIATGVECRY
jgi:glyoxylate carboligase